MLRRRDRGGGGVAGTDVPPGGWGPSGTSSARPGVGAGNDNGIW
jgi:hypothetical protein